MKSAWGLRPEGDYQRCLQQFDLREIDAPDQRSLFHLKYYDRLTKILAAIRHYCPPGANILEIGCAQANASLLLAEAGYLAVGLDLHQQALQYARRKYERGRFHSLVGWAEALPLAANAFDAAILGELLEHCADPHSVIRQACAVVKPEGIFPMATIWATLTRYINVIYSPPPGHAADTSSSPGRLTYSSSTIAA